MVIRLGDLKFKNPQAVSYQDLADTLEELVLISGLSAAQNAYQTLQANNVFENKDYLVTDEFTDSTGTNNTVNTGSSTAYFSTDHYQLQSVGDTTDVDDSHGVTLGDSGSITNSLGFKVDIIDDCVLTEVTKHPSCTATTAYLKTTSGTILKTASFSGDIATFTAPFYPMYTGETYRVELSSGGSSYTYRFNNTSVTYPYNKTNLNYVAGSTSGTADSATTAYNILTITTQDLVYISGKNVVCDTGTLTLDGTEKSICIYNDTVLPTGTSITVDISDGTNTISDKPVNDYIDVSSLSSGTLELTFNLKTTDTNETPELKGYGVFIK